MAAIQSKASARLPAGTRKAPRVRLRLRARLITRDGFHAVDLDDLSQTGARIRLHGDNHPGAEVVLQWEVLDAFAVVVWRCGDEYGLLFDAPLPLEIVIQARNASDRNPRSAKNETYVAARKFVQGRGAEE